MTMRPGGCFRCYRIEACGAGESAADAIMISTHVDACERADGVDDLVGIGAVADDVAEIPKLIEGARSGEHGLKGLKISVNIGDDQGTHRRRVSLLYCCQCGERYVT